jgi:hypothetical protein
MVTAVLCRTWREFTRAVPHGDPNIGQECQLSGTGNDPRWHNFPFVLLGMESATAQTIAQMQTLFVPIGLNRSALN